MSNVKLNLDSFLKHAKLADNTDTMVMRGDGKASVRGNFRTAFTSHAKYRETTQKFVDAYCQKVGVEKAFANEFFAENLREEGAKPLRARTVKSFLQAVDARKNSRATEKAMRAEKLNAFLAGPPEKMELFSEAKTALVETHLVECGLYEDERGQEVLNEIMIAYATISKTRPRAEFLAFVKEILNDASLSLEQGIRRLNLLTNFISTDSNSTTTFHLDKSNPFDSAVFQRLMVETDNEAVDWNLSADRILAHTFVRQGSLQKNKMVVEKSLQMEFNYLGMFKTMVNDLRQKVADMAAEKLTLLSPMENVAPEKQREMLRNAFLDPDKRLVFDGLVSSACAEYRTTHLGTFVKHASSMVLGFMPASLEVFTMSFPKTAKMDHTKLRNVSVMEQNRKLFSLDFTMKNWMKSSTPVSTVVGLTSTRKSLATPEMTLTYGRNQFKTDFNRTFLLENTDLRVGPRDVFSKTGMFVMLDKKTSKGYVDGSSRGVMARMHGELQRQQRTVDSLSDAELKTLWKETIDLVDSNKDQLSTKCEPLMDKLGALAGNRSQQVGAALVLMTQNKDNFRNPFLFMGGTIYDKAAMVQEDGSIRVVYASRKDSPVHYCRVMTVDPEGRISFDENENYMTTDASKKTPALLEYQDMFERMASGFEQTVASMDAAGKAEGAVLSEAELYQRAQEQMFAEGLPA